ncbi:MAG: PEP-CTERM sorting domain-containing protein [Candidatus Omnitrophota bacterium]
MCLNRKRLVMVLVLAVNLFFILGGGKSWAQVIPLSRESNYVINSDGSYEYSVNMVLEGDTDSYFEGYFSILSHTEDVSASGFDSFIYSNPSLLNAYYDFQHFDPDENPYTNFDASERAYLSKTYEVDQYLYYASFVGSGVSQKNILISYSGAAGSWADRSSIAGLPWDDVAQNGYWEFTGGGLWFSPIGNYTVNVTLPETTASSSVKLLGWDGNVTISSDNRFFQFTDSNTQSLDVNIAFKTTQPLSPIAPVPEPISSALFLLGAGALAGVGRLRKKIL